MMRIESIIEMLDEQFERDANGYIFRRNQVGRGVRVTAAERDEALATVRRGMRWAYVIGIPLGVAAFAAVIVAAPHRLAMPLLLLATAATAIITGAIAFRAMRAPFAALADRRREGVDRHRSDVMRARLADYDLTLGLVLSAATLVTLLKVSSWPPQGIDWMLVIFAALGPLVAAVLGVMK